MDNKNKLKNNHDESIEKELTSSTNLKQKIQPKKDMEFSYEATVEKINPKEKTRVKPENDHRKNMNETRNKQLY